MQGKNTNLKHLFLPGPSSSTGSKTWRKTPFTLKSHYRTKTNSWYFQEILLTRKKKLSFLKKKKTIGLGLLANERTLYTYLSHSSQLYFFTSLCTEFTWVSSRSFLRNGFKQKLHENSFSFSCFMMCSLNSARSVNDRLHTSQVKTWDDFVW